MAQRRFLDIEMDRALGTAVTSETPTDGEIEAMIYELELAYNTAIDAIDANAVNTPDPEPVQTPVEETAPVFVIEHTDSFTIEGEAYAVEQTDSFVIEAN